MQKPFQFGKAFFMMLPPLFTERIKATFPADEADEFLCAIDLEPAVSLRLHPLKKVEGTYASEVPWNREGRYLAERPEFIFDPLFHAGAYYVQESSSMFLKKALEKIDIPNHALVLDLCAAPGGKSTLLLSELPLDALLVANEVIRTRIPALKENIQRWGYPNAMVTNADPGDFTQLAETFDVIVVDAPCSGEGMFRKDPDATKHWSPDALETCELRQQRILKSAKQALKMGGYLIYSTCTFNPGENEAQLQTLLNEGFTGLPILSDDDFPEITRIPIGESGVGYAFYPHKVKGEGFFISILKKEKATEVEASEQKFKRAFFEKNAKNIQGTEQWLENPQQFVYKERNGSIYAVPGDLEKSMQLIASCVTTMYAGVRIGEIKGNEFLPDHALALSNIVKRDIPQIALTREDALRFLKKESIRSHDVPKGIYAVRYEGLNLGWVKAVPGRLNNLLPMEFRIRKNVEL